MRGFFRFLACALCAMIALAAAPALADGGEGGYYTVYAEDGDVLFLYAGQVFVDDEYIAGDNRYYRIDSVNDQTRTARAVFIEDFLLPDVSTDLAALAEAQKRTIAMYCTHSDESYVEGDGGESSGKGQGGIYDVAHQLKAHLQEMGVQVTLDETNHLPHDAGAYRRSRQTAAKLIQESMPAALIDIHRDGIPEPGEYEHAIDGEPITMVRLEVGRSNPNRTANKEFAAKIKAVADDRYPGLIKDIFIGKGNYNQELMPRAILMEFGTHTSDKEQVMASTKYMAEVVSIAVFGDAGQSANPDATPGASPGATPGAAQTPDVARQSAEEPLDQSSKGAGSGIFWVVGIALLGGLIILLLSTGGGRAFVDNLRGKASEMSGGLFGNRRKKD